MKIGHELGRGGGGECGPGNWNEAYGQNLMKLEAMNSQMPSDSFCL